VAYGSTNTLARANNASPEVLTFAYFHRRSQFFQTLPDQILAGGVMDDLGKRILVSANPSEETKTIFFRMCGQPAEREG
jgi:hypothetical protein